MIYFKRPAETKEEMSVQTGEKSANLSEVTNEVDGVNMHNTPNTNKKFSVFLHRLSINSGIDEDDTRLASLLANQELNGIQIHHSIMNKWIKFIYKQKAKTTSETLNPIDDRISTMLSLMERLNLISLEKEMPEELPKSTYKKLELLFKIMLQYLVKRKSDSSDIMTRDEVIDFLKINGETCDFYESKGIIKTLSAFGLPIYSRTKILNTAKRFKDYESIILNNQNTTKPAPALPLTTTDSSKESVFIDLMSVEKVADIFRLSATTIRKYTNEGLITGYKVGSKILYRKKHIIEALKKISDE